MAKNILTVDLEDWFVVEIMKKKIKYDQWSGLQSRIIPTTELLLSIFERHRVQATFFILGWIAERFPRLINRIANEGHEIACHSYHHDLVERMTPDKFREDTLLAVRAIEKACGIKPIGYRAPSWSINARASWAYEVLAELGFLYDSSLYSILHDIYGQPAGPKKVFRHILKNGRSLYVLPASTIKIMGKDIPVGGGGYLRLSPVWFTERMVRRLNAEGRPLVVYIHPWELDDYRPDIEGLSAFKRYRQYGLRDALSKKLESLLQKFDFCPACDYIKRTIAKPIGFSRHDQGRRS